MPLLLRPQLVMHWLGMHALANDSPGWPGDVSVTDLILRWGTECDGWERLVAIRRRSREEFANNGWSSSFVLAA